nr:class I SAM-dependent methyltransferase [Deinococcus budaensis]
MPERDLLLSRRAGVAWPEAPLLDRLALSPTADVLDVGAGDGRLLAALRERGHRGRRVGLDPSPGPGVLPGEAETLPFAPASFDVVLLVRVLAHLPGPERALAEARRVLRPGGRVYAAQHGEAHLARMWAALGQGTAVAGLARPGWEDLLLAVTVGPEDAQAIAASYGLEVKARDLGAAFPLRDWLHLRVEILCRNLRPGYLSKRSYPAALRRWAPRA